jgi:hypothetical protein
MLPLLKPLLSPWLNLRPSLAGGRLVEKNLRPLDTRPAETNPIFLKAVRLHGRPPARLFGFEKTRLFFESVFFESCGITSEFRSG